MENILTTDFSMNITIPKQDEIDALRNTYIQKKLKLPPETQNLQEKLIDKKNLIWVGELELSIILKLLETYNYCCQSQTHSGGTIRLIYRYSKLKSKNKLEIPKKPAITLKTIKKRTDFYIPFETLPLSMELDFETVKYKNRPPKWRWLGDPKNHTDLIRLGNYIIEIFETPFDLNEF